MRILHTSDWHLGHNFFTKDRKKEHGQFLDWLLNCLTENQIDTLIISGDIFDTAAPPNYALELYYRFIKGLAQTRCQQTIIIGGNHDSASNLQAPKELLKLFNVHVVGSISRGAPADDIFILKNHSGEVGGIVCAVPFLRERDIRTAVAGESYQEKSLSYQQGIGSYYDSLLKSAHRLSVELGFSPGTLPIISTGHLFTQGSELSDGVREIAVGSLEGLAASVFPSGFDYVALGHLHKAQTVGGKEILRYSGAPIPLSFGEARLSKQVVCVDFETGAAPGIQTIPVPVFQKIESLKGNWQEIEGYFDRVQDTDTAIWLEIILDSEEWGGQAQERISELAQNSLVEVLAVKRKERKGYSLQNTQSKQTLAELQPAEVFDELLQQTAIDDDASRQELRRAHAELLEKAWQRWRESRHED